MKPICKVLLAMFAFAFLAEALHLHDASDNYVSYLQSQQSTVKGKLDSISQKLEQNYKQV